MKKIAFFALLAAVVLFSCTTRPQRDVHISIESSAAPQICILSHDELLNDSGTMMVVLELKNRSREYFEFEYRIDWLRNGGIPVDTIMSKWQKFGLAGEETRFFKLEAPNDRVSDYRFHLRRVVK